MATKTVVLISGSGSNLQALIDTQANRELSISIEAVISNRPGVMGLKRAEKAGIATRVLDHKSFESREAFDVELQALIDTYEPELVILAGFMRILTPEFTNHYSGRMLNIHPSLLPKYQGLHTHQRALDAGDDCHGVTVHFVTAELDGGPNILQAVVPIEPDDTPETLAKRIQQQEHIIYPMAAQWFAEDRLTMQANQAILDGEVLANSGYILDTRP